MTWTLTRFNQAVTRHSWRLNKSVRNRVDRDDQQRVTVFISGCQRSGTTMLSRIFDADPRSAIFDEISTLSSDDQLENLRLNAESDVRRKLSSPAASLVVAKPLVESQRLDELLAAFEGSRSIWMYRDYSDVVRSNLKNFGDDNGHSDIEPVIDLRDDDWRSERIDPDVRQQIVSAEKQGITRNDAAALFWYGRNSHFFRQDLASHRRVRLQQYKHLVESPTEVMSSIYEFLGRDFPGERIVRNVTSSSVGKGSDVILSPHVRELCDDMLARLEAAYTDSTVPPRGDEYEETTVERHEP